MTLHDPPRVGRVCSFSSTPSEVRRDSQRPEREGAQMINGHATGVVSRSNTCIARVTAALEAVKEGRAMRRVTSGAPWRS